MKENTTTSSTANLENFKILRTIWKNSFDKILEIKVKVLKKIVGW